MNNLALRALTAILGAAIIVTAFVLSPYGFGAVCLGIMLLTLKEFYQLSKIAGRHPYELWAILFSSITFGLVFSIYELGVLPEVLWLLPALFALVFIYPLLRISVSQPIQNIGITTMGIVYIALPFILFCSIAFIQGYYNYVLVLGILFLQWSNDTGAYFAGKTMGKRKLFEAVSPKKTWEGAIGGFILSLIFAYGFYKIFGEIGLFEWLGLATIVSVFGSIGDLAESHFKRSLAIKDSGRSLPGHGGFLDRFDGLLLSLPFASTYLYLIL